MAEDDNEPRQEIVIYDAVPDRFCAVIDIGKTRYLGMNQAGFEKLQREVGPSWPDTFDVYRLSALVQTAKASTLRALIAQNVAALRVN